MFDLLRMNPVQGRPAKGTASAALGRLSLNGMSRSQMIAVSAAVICVVLIGGLLFVPLDARGTSAEDITVSPGQSLSFIATMLSDAGLIRSRFLFMAFARATGVESRLQAGTYHFSRSLSIVRVTKMLAQGLAEPSDIQVVITE